jgi:hypothetical protein
VPQAWPFDWGRVGANQQDNGITRIEKAGSERELLSLFLSKLQKLDPDIIIGEFEGVLHRVGNKKPTQKNPQKTTYKNPLKMFFILFCFLNFIFFMKIIQTFLFGTYFL